MANRGGTQTGGRGDPDQRQTKAERKEQARLDRERIQREMRARHRRRNIGLALVGVGVVAALVLFLVVLPSGNSGDLPKPADLLAQAKDATTSAACTAPQKEGFYDGVTDTTSPKYADQAHIGSDPRFPSMPDLSTYPSTPPASGPHNQTPLAHGVYDSPPPLDQAIHSLEHAGAIIWYSPSAPSDVIDQIKAFYSQTDNVGQAKVIVAPYDYPTLGPGGKLPAGTKMALVAWHTMQTCTDPNLAVAFDFTSQYTNAYPGGTYIGEAPEPPNGF